MILNDVCEVNKYHFCSEYHIVFLNGVIVGLTIDPQRIVSTIRAVRRHGLLNEFVSVSTNAAQRSVYIASDGGRLCRPYIIVTNGVPQVAQGHIEVDFFFKTFWFAVLCWSSVQYFT